VGSFAIRGVATADELLRLGREPLATANGERARTFFEQASEVARAEALFAGPTDRRGSAPGGCRHRVVRPTSHPARALRRGAEGKDWTTATPNGLLPVATVAVTLNVLGSMTDSVLAPWFAT
jgi:hypothetical protein